MELYLSILLHEAGTLDRELVGKKQLHSFH